MPYTTKKVGSKTCVYKKDGGAKVGCTDGPVSKYLGALHANANEGEEEKLRYSGDNYDREEAENNRYDRQRLSKKNPFKIGDEVKLSDKALVNHSKSVPAHAGYTTDQFKWRDTLRKLEGKVGIIKRLFDQSKHVNVDFNGQVIGIDYTDLVPANASLKLTEIAKRTGLIK